MYGLWLYKEFATEYGRCRVEIKQQDYSGNAIEIEAFAADSLTVSMQNLSEIISSVGKSVCSFGIINTGQFDYDSLFTPSATKYIVAIQTKVDGGEWKSRWSGFLTPDFFAEDLQYRAIISLSARDNIGYLNDIPFDYTDYHLIKISELFNMAFNRISAEYPMDVVIDTKKLIDGRNLADTYLSVDVFKGKSWGEAVEMVLHDCGLQMRWLDNNIIKVYDLAYMPAQYLSQEVFFVQNSGYREILPAWRSLEQSQGYIGKGDLYDGVANAELMVLDHTAEVYVPMGVGGSGVKALMYYYKLLSSWTTAWNAYTAKNMDAPLQGVYISHVGDGNAREQDYIVYERNVAKADYPITITLSASKTLHFNTREGYMKAYPVDNFYDDDRTDFLQLDMFVSILLHADDGNTYYLGDNWVEYTSDTKNNSIRKFTLNKATYGNIIPEDITIISGIVPYSGKMVIRLHGFSVADKSFYVPNGLEEGHREPTWDAFFAKIDNVTITYNSDQLPAGIQSGVLINENHNIKRNEDYTISTLPAGIDGESIVVNGVYDGDGNTLYKVKLGENPEEYKLMELVGREAIHYNIKNYEKLSGAVKSMAQEPLQFDRLYNFNGKKYIPYAYELSLISNTMNVTAMQEVEDYRVASLVEEESEVSIGVSNTGLSGDNLILKYSENAGNAKRIYELDTATDEELSGAYIILDKAGLPSAKKYSLQSIADTLDWFELRTLETGTKILFTKYTLVSALDQIAGGVGEGGSSSSGAAYNRLDTWENYNENAGDVLSAKLGYDLKKQIEQLQQSGGSGESVVANITVKIGDAEYTAVDGVVSLPAYPTVPTVPTKLSELIDDLVAGNYLPLTGGILSGALSAPSINITSAAAVAHLAFGRQGGNIITAPSGGYFSFIPGGKSVATANADLVITDGIVYPGTTGVTKLGFEDKRWSQVSSVDGDFSGALTAGTFSTANVVSCGGRLRINASNSVNSFGFLKATAYTTSLNRAVLNIGSNYGGSSDITSEAVDVVAMSIYRGAVGVGRAFTYDELYANKASNIMLSVDGNINNVGDIVSTGEQVAGSDMRYKIVKSKFRLSSAIIAHAPLFRFKWKNHKTTKLKIGTSAQYWEEFAPELVTFDSVSDFKHLNYAGLGVAIGISNAREIEQLKKEIVSLKERLAKYEHN